MCPAKCVSRVVFVCLITPLMIGVDEAQSQGEPPATVSTAIRFWDGETDARVKSKRMTVEIGDSNTEGFDPVFMITLWQGECRFRVNLSTPEHPMISPEMTNSSFNDEPRVELSNLVLTHDMFARNETEFEWQIILKEMPDTNVFIYPIEIKGLVFYYQDSAAMVADETFVEPPDIPDSVFNSYAVYHASKRDNHIKINGADTNIVNYKTGKAFHIYRPRVWDASGKDTLWCDLHIDTKAGCLSVNVPAIFLEHATYPVTIDPTFGNTTKGAGFGGIGSGYNWSFQRDSDWHTAGTGETVTELTVSLGTGSATAQMAIYDCGANVPDDLIDNTTDYTGVGTNSPGTWTSKTGLSISMTSGVDYSAALGVLSAVCNINYDYVGYPPPMTRDDQSSPLQWNNPWDHDADNTNYFSFYATYTTGGGETYRRRRIITGDE